jgi:hypothetical protein
LTILSRSSGDGSWCLWGRGDWRDGFETRSASATNCELSFQPLSFSKEGKYSLMMAWMSLDV